MTDPSGLHNPSTPNDDHNELIFAYLDGELTEHQCAEFEALRASNPDIQRRLDTLNAVKHSLIRIDESARSGAIPMPHPALEPASEHTPKSKARWLAYAAILTIMVGLFIYMNPPKRVPTYNAQRFYTQVTTDFVPDIVCDSPEKFQAYTLEAFGAPIGADFDTPLQLVGWKYLGGSYTSDRETKTTAQDTAEANAATHKGSSRLLMARTPDGTPTIAIFIGTNPNIVRFKPVLPEGSSFHIYTRKIHSIKIIEISPLDTPVLLDLLSAE